MVVFYFYFYFKIEIFMLKPMIKRVFKDDKTEQEDDREKRRRVLGKTAHFKIGIKTVPTFQTDM